jgi:hypothetical protein
MTQRIVLICSLILFGSTSFAQQFVPDAAYRKQTVVALQHYINNEFRAAALSYDSAFSKAGGKALAMDRFYAAFSWAMADDKQKAMAYLDKAIREEKFSDVTKFINESEFMKVKDHPNWNHLLELVKKNKEEKEAHLDKDLIRKLDSIYENDQADHLKADSIQRKFGRDSKQMQEHWKIISHKDSLNLTVVKEILDKRGWLGSDVVGEKGNTTLFLVIQHGDPASQEKYLPMLRKAVQKGDATASQLALLEDRTRMNKGEKQLYGSQLNTNPVTKKLEFYPIEDETNVNERRAAMGLEPLEEYAKRFGLDYTLPKQEQP